MFFLLFKVLKSGYDEESTDITVTGTEENNEVAKKMIEEAIDGGTSYDGSSGKYILAVRNSTKFNSTT